MNKFTSFRSPTNPCFAARHRGNRVGRLSCVLGAIVVFATWLLAGANAAPFTPGNLAIVQADASPPAFQ